MIYLLSFFWLPMLTSAVLGLIIGRWIWFEPIEEEVENLEAEEHSTAPYIPPAPPPIETENEPVVETVAEPEPERPSIIPVLPEPEADAQDGAPSPASPFLDAPAGDPDNLTLIKGVGPKLADMLNALGVFHFSQIADWNSEQIAEVDSHLATFSGRIERDRWVEQARLLDARNVAAFEREFGKMNGQF